MNNSEENLTPDSDADNVEMQRRFNELRGELLDKRTVSIDRWLSVIGIVLTFFGIVVVLGGYIGFKRFWDIETKANESAAKAAKYAQDAEHLLDKMKERNEKFVEYDVFLRKKLFEVEASEEAKEDIWRAIAQTKEGIDNDQAARAWFSAGYLLGNSEESISAYNRAISLKPDYADAYNNRGNAKIALGQHNEAIADYDKAIQLKQNFAEAYNNRGVAKAELKQYEKAIADYDKAIQLKPDYADAYNNRGNAKALLERYADAIADYDVAIRLKPDYAEAYNARGTAKVLLGQSAETSENKLKLIDEARQDFEKARDLAREAGNDSLAAEAEQNLRVLDSQEDE